MDAIANAISDQLISLIGLVFTAIAGYASVQLKKYLDRRGVLQELEVYEKAANTAVKAIQQLYQDLDGPEKFAKAKNRLATDLQNKGIPVEEKDLQFWIESAVYGMNEGWNTATTVVLPEQEAITIESPAAELPKE
jgi:LL-H family phage holin|nr:MAG TPA: holin [Caudoviricetes sp.]